MKKRILAAILCLVMVISNVPAMELFAAGDTHQFVLDTDGIDAGAEYIIANNSAGRVNVLTNNGNKIANTTAVATDGVIPLFDNDAACTFVFSDDSQGTVKSGSRYLNVASGSLSWSTSSQLLQFSQQGDNGAYRVSVSSWFRRYYVTCNNSAWTGTSNATNVYLYKKVPLFSVTYNGNGNTAGTIPAEDKYVNLTSGHIHTVETPDPNLIKTVGQDEYLFQCWNTQADGKGKDYMPGDKITVTQDVILYAKWYFRPKYEISVETNLDNVATDIKDIIGKERIFYVKLDGQDTEYIELSYKETGIYAASVTESGTYYVYYKESKESETYVKAHDHQIIIFNQNGSTTLQYYSVKYMSDGKEVFRDIYHGNEQVLVTDRIPEKDGYVFKGWNYGETTLQAGQLVTSELKAPQVLEAIWEEGNNVTVTINVDYTSHDGGTDSASTRDDVVLQLMQVVGEVNEPVGDPVSLNDELNEESTPPVKVQKTDKGIQYVYTFYYLPKDVTYNIATSKNGYDVAITKDSENPNKITVYYKFTPTNHDLHFKVQMAEGMPKELYPKAVNVKILFWGNNKPEEENTKQWYTITQQRNVGDVIVAPSVVQIGADGTGEGFYSVWRNWGDTQEAYEYRVEVTSFVMPDGTVVPASSDNWVLYESSQSGLYHATVGVTGGRRPETAGNNGLLGAYFAAKSETDNTIVQHGEIVVTVNATPFTVTFYANGGTIEKEDEHTMTNQYKYPNLNLFVPVPKENEQLLFDGWFLDQNGNGILEDEERAQNTFTSYLTGNVAYIARWKEPVKLSGTVTVDGSYQLGDVQQSVWERDRAKEVAIVLQKKTGTAYNDIASCILKITYDSISHIGTTDAYSFVVPADGADYRIHVLELNYTATYDNQDADQTFTADENIITDMLEDRTVNVKMTFEPESYEQRLLIDATKINSTYRPSDIHAKILYRNLGTSDKFETISQHANTAMEIELIDGIGLGEQSIWKWHTDGKLYEYKAGDFKLFGNVEGVYIQNGTEYDPKTSPYTIYFGTNAWWDNELNDENHELQATLVPKTYTITFDMAAGDDTIYGMDEYMTDSNDDGLAYSYRHTWSFSDYLTALPYRAGYVFTGWSCAEEDRSSVIIDSTTGGQVTIGAAVSKDITLTATWEEIHVSDTRGYYAVRHLELNTDKVLHKAQVFKNIPFGEKISVFSKTLQLDGYKYAGYKFGEGDYVEAGNEEPFIVSKDGQILITIYYLPDGSDGYTEQVESNLHISKDAILEDDGTYTITMDMYTKDNPITTQILQNTPLDIVLVLDQSGSIYKDGFLDELQSSVSNFVTLIADHGRQNEVDHRIAIVGYASDEDMGDSGDDCPIAGGSDEKWVNTGVFDSNGDFHNYPTTGFVYTKTNEKPQADGTYYALSDGEYQLLLHHDTYYHLLTEEEARTEQLKGSPIYGYVDGDFVELVRNASGLWLYDGKQKLYSAKEFFTYHVDVWTHRKGIEKRQIHAYGTGNNYTCVDNHGDLYTRTDTTGNSPQLNVYKDALVPVSIGANGAGGVNPGLQASVSHLGASGGTCVEYGIEMANKVFAANPIAEGDNRVRIMVMFTDGVPGQYDFDTNAANRAIALAYKTKNEYNAYSYTIGLYQSDGVTGTSEESIFMHAVSSNYKTAMSMNDVFTTPTYSTAKSQNLNDGDTYAVKVSGKYYQLRYGSHTPSGSSARVGWHFTQDSGWPITISTNRSVTTSSSGKLNNYTIYEKSGSYKTETGTGHYSTTESENDLKQFFADVVKSITTKITTEIILHSDTIMRDIMGRGLELTKDTVITIYTQNGTYNPQTKGITWAENKELFTQLALINGIKPDEKVIKSDRKVTIQDVNGKPKEIPYIQVYNWGAENTTNPDGENYSPHTVDISGYDFTNGYISENHPGFKLIVTITKIEARDDVEWGRSTRTNYETSGIWLPADRYGSRQLLLPFEQPTTIFTERSYVLDYAKEFELAGWYYNQVETQGKGTAMGSSGTAKHLDSIVTDGMNGFNTDNPTTKIESSYGKSNLKDKLVRYTPMTMQWVNPEQFYVFGNTDDDIIRKQDANRNGNLWTRVNVIPANNVYYEDSFESTTPGEGEKGFSGFQYNDKWTVVKEDGYGQNTETPEHLEDQTYGDVHGWIDSMNDDTTFSDGSAHKAGENQTKGAQVKFTFVGTGVDIYTRTNRESGMVLAMLKGTTMVEQEKVTKSVIVDNLAVSGDYYNIPTISFNNLKYGTYEITLVANGASESMTGKKRFEYYLDGIRVYNPLGGDRTADHLNDKYNSIIKDAYANEQNAIFETVRNILLEDYNSLNGGVHEQGEPGAVFIDWIRGEKPGDGGDTYNIAEYKAVGPKNEVYLSKGQSIVLKVDPQYTYYVGMKSLNGKTVYANVSGVDNINNPSIMEINHSIDQAYKIKPSDGYIVIGNNLIDQEGQDENAILSITKLCVTSLYEPAKEYIQPITATESVETVTNMVMFMRRPAPTPEPEPLPEEPEAPEIEDGDEEEIPGSTPSTPNTPSTPITPSQTVVTNKQEEPITSNSEQKQESTVTTGQTDSSDTKEQETEEEETTDVEEEAEEQEEKLGFFARIARFFEKMFQKIGQWFQNLFGGK